MFYYLQGQGRMAENGARAMFQQLVATVLYRPQRGIILWGPKPENMLSDAELKVRLVDLGLGTEFWGHKLSLFGGSLPCAAPGLFLRRTCDSHRATVGRLGCCWGDGHWGPVFPGGGRFWELRQKVLSRHCHVPRFLSSECEKLFKKLITLHPRGRRTRHGAEGGTQAFQRATQ